MCVCSSPVSSVWSWASRFVDLGVEAIERIFSRRLSAVIGGVCCSLRRRAAGPVGRLRRTSSERVDPGVVRVHIVILYIRRNKSIPSLSIPQLLVLRFNPGERIKQRRFGFKHKHRVSFCVKCSGNVQRYIRKKRACSFYQSLL